MTKEASLSGFAKWRRDIADSIYEEISAMMSGHFIPYHKLCFMAAFLTALIFSILFTQMGVIEAPVAVVDLDHSARSAKFIQAVDSSRDIRIASVFHTPVDPVYLTRHDNVVGVMVIPKGFEKGLLNGTTPYNIGYEADMGNPAQNGEVFESLNQIAAQEGIPVNAENLQALGPASAQSSGSSGLTVSIRRLFNPTNSLVPVTIAGFLYFFSGIFFGITTLMLTGRVHVMGQWENAILNRGPSAMIARLIPYALGYTAAVTIMTAGLVLFNCMPFKGNYLAYPESLHAAVFDRSHRDADHLELQDTGKRRILHDLRGAARLHHGRHDDGDGGTHGLGLVLRAPFPAHVAVLDIPRLRVPRHDAFADDRALRRIHPLRHGAHDARDTPVLP